MEKPPGRRHCGFCGYPIPSPISELSWASHFRAVYSTDSGPGGNGGGPKLSGVGRSHCDEPDQEAMAEYFVPPEPHQRYDDPDLPPHALLGIWATSSCSPPSFPSLGPVDGDDKRDSDSSKSRLPLTEEENRNAADDGAAVWGFLFHDACWQLLEQVGDSPVDLETLWRILLSMPCTGGDGFLPDWGHGYGGLWSKLSGAEVRGDNDDGDDRKGAVRLRLRSNYNPPSTIMDPFHVPELMYVVKAHRIALVPEDDSNGSSGDHHHHHDENSDRDNPEGNATTTTITPRTATATTPNNDPFARLPLELRELLLTHCGTRDAASLRLASRAVAAEPLTQRFFRSRFAPGGELQLAFDGFLPLATTEQRRYHIDWAALYRVMAGRQRGGCQFLGERNRHRIWRETLGPLSAALRRIARLLSPLRGVVQQQQQQQGLVGVRTAWNSAFGPYSLFTNPTYIAEAHIPAAKEVQAVGVSLITFFDEQYVTGLRFVYSDPVSPVEIGYIAPPHSETMLRAEGSLYGFHTAVYQCGFTGLGLITSGDMQSEYLAWAGMSREHQKLTTIKAGGTVRRVKAHFDGFRMQALFIQDT